MRPRPATERLVASALELPLDVLISRKLRSPINPELAIGAVAEIALHGHDFFRDIDYLGDGAEAEHIGEPRECLDLVVRHAEAAANMLTNPQLDPFGKIPEYKFCAARVEPLAQGAAAE